MMTQRLVIWTGIAFVCTCGMLSAQTPDDEGVQTIRGFTLPEYNENMELVSKIEGDAARVLDDGKFDITNLRFEMYKKGKVDARVTAPSCIFHKTRNEGWSSGSIRITRDDLVVTGEDFRFSGKKEQISIRKNAKVVLRSVNVKIWGDDNE